MLKNDFQKTLSRGPVPRCYPWNALSGCSHPTKGREGYALYAPSAAISASKYSTTRSNGSKPNAAPIGPRKLELALIS